MEKNENDNFFHFTDYFSESDSSALKEWMAELLVAHEYAKLGQAGHTEHQIALQRVFVDLPIKDNEAQHEQFFLKNFLDSRPLTSFGDLGETKKSLSEGLGELNKDNSKNNIALKAERSFAASLIIGGPGQGKSTLSQLACQLHRVAMLAAYKDSLPFSQIQIIKNFLEFGYSYKKENTIKIPRNPLLPIHISLPDFSSWLKNENLLENSSNDPILLKFIVDQPSSRKSGLTNDILKRCLGKLPSLIVLDGFDEVGSKKDRSSIVSVAKAFLRFLHMSKSSIQIIATTRPQGYSDELDRIGVDFRKIILSPLDRNLALEYAKKLIEAKIPGVDKKNEMLLRFNDAARDSSTARLLTTPLQITILAALIQQLGKAPKEKWNLFHRFFTYTYDREIERNTYASNLLLTYRTHIERIHTQIALILQSESEHTGGASARISRKRLENIIDSILLEEEFTDLDRFSLVKEISEAAENRLVFIVEPEPGNFGFEIRSLQEFMAAWALSYGREEDVLTRLKFISKATLFRNVMLFMISKIYCEGSVLRDIVPTEICRKLNEDRTDPQCVLLGSGSTLALDILEEGAAISQPKRARILLEEAILLFNAPSGNECFRIVAANTLSNSNVLENLIQLYLSKNDQNESYYKAWAYLVEGTNQKLDWAIRLGDLYWPQIDDISKLAEHCGHMEIRVGPWFGTRLQETKQHIDFSTLFYLETAEKSLRSATNWTSFLILLYEKIAPWNKKDGDKYLSPLVPFALASLPKKINTVPKKWHVWYQLAIFESSPSVENLVLAFNSIETEKNLEEIKKASMFFSWPLKFFLFKANSLSQIRDTARRIYRGEFGNAEQWIAAQKRWKKVDFTNFGSNLHMKFIEILEDLNSGPPVELLAPWQFKKKMSESEKLLILKRASIALRGAVTEDLKSHLSSICCVVAGDLSYMPVEIGEEWLQSVTSAEFLLPRPKWLDISKWRRLILNEKIDSVPNIYLSIEECISIFAELDGDPKILKMLAYRISLHWHFHSNENKAYGSLIKTLQNHSYTSKKFDLQKNIILFCLGLNDESLINKICVDGNLIDSLDEIYWEALLRFGINSENRNKIAIKLILPLWQKYLSEKPQPKLFYVLMRRDFSSRVTGIGKLENWNRLNLPSPLPQIEVGQLETNVLKNSFIINEMEIRNIKGIDGLSIKFADVPFGVGQWNIFIGPNGVGKTTLLRALVLALRNVSNPAIWPKNSLSHEWHSSNHGNFEGLQEGFIRIKSSSEEDFKTIIRSERSMLFSQTPPIAQNDIFPVFAYGCRRGSALGAVRRMVNLDENEGPDIATLFDDGAELIHAETWLLQLEGDAQKNPESSAVLKAIFYGLKKLLGLEDIQVHDRKVWVIQAGGIKLHLSALSDGYLTSAGWVVDLIARWIERQDNRAEPLSENFFSSMSGIVFIDEIDLHLHPKWQVDIVSNIRSLFPKMSFFVTTHNPLCLVGARSEEIHILSMHDGKLVVDSGVADPVLLTSSQIFRKYFDMENVFPNTIGKELDRYNFLKSFSLRTEEEQVELSNLEFLLKNKGITLDWKPSSDIDFKIGNI